MGHVWQQRKGRELAPLKARRVACEVADCDGAHYSKGYCQTHYGRYRRNGDPNVVKTGGAPRKPSTPCRVADCSRDAKARGLCPSHYGMEVRYGDPTAPKQLPFFGVPFWERAEVIDDADSCWNWSAHGDGDGRGRIRWNGRQETAPRVAWMLTYGPIPGTRKGSVRRNSSARRA